MRQIVIVLLIIIALASLKAENVRLSKEIHNLKGVHADAVETMWNLTHPATVQQRQLDYIMRRGEFKP